MTAVEQLLATALELTLDERLQLAELLLDSADEPDPEWWASIQPEMDRRIRAVESGEAKTTPWNEVRERMFERVNAPRD